jgi:hypothetical protein
MIQTSLDWPAVEQDLLVSSRGLRYQHQLVRMIHNINQSVSDLSRAEVAARRGKRTQAEGILDQINQDIEMVREYILVARLLG